MPDPALDFNHNQPVYTVSEVAQQVKRSIEDRFGTVRLRGEISGFKLHSSGHAYFCLKDDGAVIDAVCWRGSVGKLPFKPGDGLEVVCRGKLTTYPGRSKYQIVVESMEPAGAGALMALLDKRRRQLEAEGLFDASRKRQLPFLPQVVGVVTSPTGAVIRDILHRISARFPVHVLVWPVAVQGEAAAGQVAAAIEGFNALPEGGPCPRPDILIVARGGGSIEDLWAFNEEIVVRAAAGSRIPLISAVGHETDTTLIDYASDLRAPTPTAAAEMAVPVRDELWLTCKQCETRLHAGVRALLGRREESLSGLSRGLPRPQQLLQTAEQRLDDWGERLLAALPGDLARRAQRLAVLAGRLQPQVLLGELRALRGKLDGWSERLHAAPASALTQRSAALEQLAGRLRPQAVQAEISKRQERLDELGQRLHAAQLRGIGQRTEKLAGLAALLASVDHRRILERGFALVRDQNGRLITAAAQARQSGSLRIAFADGEVSAKT